MTQLILHHYELSPFAEKVRRMLAFKQLAWASVRVPAVMPKPDLVALTGGYRKVPVLQMGNHVYCDTALIARVLEGLAPSPTLYPDPLASPIAEWADNTVFAATRVVTRRPSRLDDVLRWLTPNELERILEDRRTMETDARIPQASAATASVLLAGHFAWLERLLNDRAFILGEQPSVADFAMYVSTWLLQHVAPEPIAKLPNVQTWRQRMAAFPESTSTNMMPADALLVCRKSEGAVATHANFLDPAGFAFEQTVMVRAIDYGREPALGALVAADDREVVLRRYDERAGTVYVHFPRTGYEISAADAAA